MTKIKTSIKYLIASFVCLFLILFINIAMVNYWLDYSVYNNPAIITVSTLFALAVTLFITFLIKYRRGE